MRGSHFENQACGRGQEGGKARSQLQSVGWQGRLDCWAGWNAGEQSLSFFAAIAATSDKFMFSLGLTRNIQFSSAFGQK